MSLRQVYFAASMSLKDKLSMFLRETVQAFGIYNVCVCEVLFLIVFMFSLCCSEKSTCGKQSGVGGGGKGKVQTLV